MKVTNKSGIPDPIYRALSKDEYSPGESDITISQLGKPGRMVRLEKELWDELEDDVADRIWLLFGIAIHNILEKGADPSRSKVEERLYTNINGWKVGGKYDHFDFTNHVLDDYKSTVMAQVERHLRGEDLDWTAQLNCYAYLLEESGQRVDKLQIVAFIKDWSRNKATHEIPLGVKVIAIERWPREKTLAWMTERVTVHQEAQKQLPSCTPEERWQKPNVWAVMKEGRKSAVKLHYDEESAKNMLDQVGSGHHIEYRKGQSARCNYCLVGKNGFCSQWNEEQKESS